MYDPETRVGGLAHVLLPSSEEAVSVEVPGKFADLAVPILVEEVVRLGANPTRLVGKIAGGAQMLAVPQFSNGFNVGERNVQAVKAALMRCGVPLLGADTGGKRGRSLSMHLGTGKVLVRILGERVTEL